MNELGKRYFVRRTVIDLMRDDPKLWGKIIGAFQIYAIPTENILPQGVTDAQGYKLVEIEWRLKD